jgi:hypothetical protein
MARPPVWGIGTLVPCRPMRENEGAAVARTSDANRSDLERYCARSGMLRNHHGRGRWSLTGAAGNLRAQTETHQRKPQFREGKSGLINADCRARRRRRDDNARGLSERSWRSGPRTMTGPAHRWT